MNSEKEKIDISDLISSVNKSDKKEQSQFFKEHAKHKNESLELGTIVSGLQKFKQKALSKVNEFFAESPPQSVEKSVAEKALLLVLSMPEYKEGSYFRKEKYIFWISLLLIIIGALTLGGGLLLSVIFPLAYIMWNVRKEKMLADDVIEKLNALPIVWQNNSIDVKNLCWIALKKEMNISYCDEFNEQLNSLIKNELQDIDYINVKKDDVNFNTAKILRFQQKQLFEITKKMKIIEENFNKKI